MSVYQRGSKWYINVKRKGVGSVRRSTSATNKKEAEAIERWVGLQLDHGTAPQNVTLTPSAEPQSTNASKAGPTLREAYLKAMRTHWNRSKSIRSFYVGVGTAMVDRIGPDVPLQDITPAIMDRVARQSR